ncbi:MAG: c-type cytochrome [Roseicyclus sp.]|nr:c-type cytochrome [Roseicyclus sp.]
MRRTILIVVIGLSAAVAYWLFVGGSDPQSQEATPESGGSLADVIVPDTFTTNAQLGEQVYTAVCAECHGANAAGIGGVAPPLVHAIYRPSHHGDEAFQVAASVGVRAHHWPFGNMPPVEGLTRGDVAMVVTYIRELQEANGIN